LLSLKECISSSHSPKLELLPAFTAERKNTSSNPNPNPTSISMATNMENIRISEGTNHINENNPDIELATLDLYAHMPPKPMGTRPCSPSESDISAYALPPPAYHASLDVLPAVPAPTTTVEPIESAPARNILPIAAPAAIPAPAPAVIASTPAAVQISSLGTVAQPAPAETRGRMELIDVESLEDRRRRRNSLVDNAVVRGLKRAGAASVWWAQDLHRRRPWIINCLAIVLLTDSVIFFITLIYARATKRSD
jgi:hypothetical protein